jgi:hypothetical protein
MDGLIALISCADERSPQDPCGHMSSFLINSSRLLSANLGKNSRKSTNALPKPHLTHFLLMCLLGAHELGCDEDKPYTPFQVASSLPDQDPPPSEVEDAGKEPPKTTWKKALRAPLAKKGQWKVLGRTLNAPAGTELEVALPILNSQSDELAVWVLPKQGKAGGEPGLWVFDQGGRPTRKLFSLPDFLPSGSDCKLRAELTGTGPRTITSEVTAACSARLLPGTPVVSLAVLDLSRPEPELLHIRAQEAAAGETRDVVVD